MGEVCAACAACVVCRVCAVCAGEPGAAGRAGVCGAAGVCGVEVAFFFCCEEQRERGRDAQGVGYGRESAG